MNVLSTNFSTYLTYRETLKAAKDCIKHFGQGERIRFDLHVFRNLPNHPEVYYTSSLPFIDPWYKNKDVLLEVLRYWHELRKNQVCFQIFAYRSGIL